MQMKAGDDECKDEHEECKSNSDLCSKDTYSVMMVYLCPLTCSFCEARKHFPDSGLSCTDHTPRCIKKSHKDKCETDEEIKKSCPWTCKTCSNDQTETAKA
ncbi:hypothetical protein M3Y97_01098200 [Aphelenchoides bicaudatus]|nr:hypothetical protein M3Y97_01098200 [Aphelenchoides bicaudatus]